MHIMDDRGELSQLHQYCEASTHGRPSDPVSPVLSIAEIVSSILAFSDKDGMTKAALVCRKWHAISLPHIWRDLDCLLALLELFCPMTYQEDGWVGLVRNAGLSSSLIPHIRCLTELWRPLLGMLSPLMPPLSGR